MDDDWGDGIPVWHRAYPSGPAAAKGAAEAARARAARDLKFIVIKLREREWCRLGLYPWAGTAT